MCWFLLGTGVFSLLCAAFIAIELLQHLDTVLANHDDAISRSWLFGFVLFFPACLIFFGSGAYIIGLVTRDWHGNANRAILLRLLESEEKGSGV